MKYFNFLRKTIDKILYMFSMLRLRYKFVKFVYKIQNGLFYGHFEVSNKDPNWFMI